MPNPTNPKATRRVPLELDEHHNPVFTTVCSPTSYQQLGLCITPPKHVIPIIFVPGIMGTHLKTNSKSRLGPNKDAWTVPNGGAEGYSEWKSRKKQTPTQRQIQLNPEGTDVNTDGEIEIPSDLYTLTKAEAKVRGWGEISAGSYHAVMSELERALNDRHTDAGTRHAAELPVWKVAKTLEKQSGLFGLQTKSVLQEWNPQCPGGIPPLTDAEFHRLADYYYPVWACGYNWLQSNDDSADRLVQRINDAIAYYAKSSYFIPVGKVIVVTHSMGGIVGRRASQKAPTNILGVVHGVQPIGGAPVVYRRFRYGTESAGGLTGPMVATVIGNSADQTTPVLGNARGPMELLPTKSYPKGWLRAVLELDKGDLMTMPKSGNPYAEIYCKRVQDVWWGMVDETLLDPAQMTPSRSTAYKAFQKNLHAVEQFHDLLGLHFHKPTYGYFGSDQKQAAFGDVQWVTSDSFLTLSKDVLPTLKAESWRMNGDTKLGEVSSKDGSNTYKTYPQFRFADRPTPENDSSIHAGDGTVPRPSGALLKDGAVQAFALKGFDHQYSYNNETARDVTIYSIAKIVQLATPAKDLKQTK